MMGDRDWWGKKTETDDDIGEDVGELKLKKEKWWVYYSCCNLNERIIMEF